MYPGVVGSDGPLHKAEDSPVALPNWPRGHGEQSDTPVKLYWPAEHSVGELHAAGHFEPAGHWLQAPTFPAVENVPGGHAIAETAVAPTGQYCPGAATHCPEQVDDVRPWVAPYSPAGHGVHKPTVPSL